MTSDSTTLRADTVLVSDVRVRFDRPLTTSGTSHLCESTVAGLAVRRDNVLATRCEPLLSVTPP